MGAARSASGLGGIPSRKGLGQAQEPGAAGRGFPPGEGDLRADPGAKLGRRDTRCALGPALGQVESDRDPGLQRGRGGLQVLQLPELVHQP
ncbi:MAG: hypothetical protein JWM13_2092, partial [Arthrobacter sp.]|nr:hypothetical protein [Arthrobacter sp.]